MTLLAAAGLLLAMAVGCVQKSAQQNPADIERAVKEYLAKKPGLSADSMQVEVRNVQFHGESADAEVLFRSKANPQASMTMNYTLKRTGPGTWMVEGAKGSGAGQQAHPGMPAPEGRTPTPFGPSNPALRSPHGTEPAPGSGGTQGAPAAKTPAPAPEGKK